MFQFFHAFPLGYPIVQFEVDVIVQEEWACGSVLACLERAAVCGAAAESCHANSLSTAVDAVPVPAVLSVLFLCQGLHYHQDLLSWTDASGQSLNVHV